MRWSLWRLHWPLDADPRSTGSEDVSLFHRSGEDGSVLAEGSFDYRVEDLVVLPDGGIFVVGTDDDIGLVQEVTIGGDALVTHTSETADYLHAAWDPVTQSMYVGGSARDPGAPKSALREVFGRDAVARFSLRDPLDAPDSGSEVLDVVPLPAGGFAEIRSGAEDVLTVTCQ